MNFNTDGDFSFRDRRELFNPDASLYKGASIKYDIGEGYDDISFSLYAEGDPNPCRWAARDLMESLVCSIQTNKYYVIKYLYDLIVTARIEYLWSGEDVDYFDSISGNYEGTELHLRIVH